RPGKLQIRPAQRCVLGAHQGVSLHEQAGPGGAKRMAGSGFEKHREVHQPADRRGGDLAGEVNKVSDEPPWSTQRKVTSFWLVHPCTPRRDVSGSVATPSVSPAWLDLRTVWVRGR